MGGIGTEDHMVIAEELDGPPNILPAHAPGAGSVKVQVGQGAGVVSEDVQPEHVGNNDRHARDVAEMDSTLA
jgi:hypothetical protein